MDGTYTLDETHKLVPTPNTDALREAATRLGAPVIDIKLAEPSPSDARGFIQPPRTVAKAQPITIDWRRVLPRVGNTDQIRPLWIAVERHMFADREHAYLLIEPVVSVSLRTSPAYWTAGRE